jgi:Endodeoxyribonuclease RusA
MSPLEARQSPCPVTRERSEYPWPSSWALKKRAEPAAKWKVSPPDIDNVCLKLVMDSLNGVAWVDDSRVCASHLFKCLRASSNRDRGEPHGSTPPTPPDIRVRIRRFGGLSEHLFPQEGWPPRFQDEHPRLRFGPCIATPSGFTFQRWRAGRTLPVACRMAPSRCASTTPHFQPFGPSAGSLRLLCPLLTSALRSDRLTTTSVSNPGHNADLPR